MWLQWFAFHISKEQGMIWLNRRGGIPSKGFWLHQSSSHCTTPPCRLTGGNSQEYSSVTHRQAHGALSGKKPAFWQTGREELGGFLFLAQVGGKYQIFFFFFAWKKVSNSRGFFRTVKLSNLLLIEMHLASLSGAGNRDLGFRLSLLRINFLFSAKCYLPHFVLSIIHGCTCWPFYTGEQVGESHVLMH